MRCKRSAILNVSDRRSSQLTRCLSRRAFTPNSSYMNEPRGRSRDEQHHVRRGHHGVAFASLGFARPIASVRTRNGRGQSDAMRSGEGISGNCSPVISSRPNIVVPNVLGLCCVDNARRASERLRR
jgi:hypothetical protein